MPMDANNKYASMSEYMEALEFQEAQPPQSAPSPEIFEGGLRAIKCIEEIAAEQQGMTECKCSYAESVLYALRETKKLLRADR